jgi:hypothetical protein
MYLQTVSNIAHIYYMVESPKSWISITTEPQWKPKFKNMIKREWSFIVMKQISYRETKIYFEITSPDPLEH